MKVLIVASYNKNRFVPFVKEQAEALQKVGCIVDFYGVVGKGVRGYLSALPVLKQKISDFKPDVIHAHFGLCGLLANLQRKVPVVTTYHGCDINNIKLRPLSFPSLLLSKYNIFVSKNQKNKVSWILGKNADVIPCGVNTDFFVPQDKKDARERLKLPLDKTLILFSSTFARPEKNAILAKDSVSLLKNVELLELDGYTREEVFLLMNAVDCGLLTSIREGSPQFTKELLSCRRPIVSTNVGDVAEQFKDVEGVFIGEFDANDIAEKIQKAISFNEIVLPDNWNEKYDNKSIALKLISIYTNVLKNK